MSCETNPVLILLEQGHSVRSVEEEGVFDWYIDDVKVTRDDPLYPDLIEVPGCAQVDVIGIVGDEEEDELIRIIKHYRAPAV